MAGGRLLTVSQYLAGADDVKFVEKFPSEQTTFQYNFGTNITNYSFELDAQTIVVDTLTYDRTTGDPNFAESTVLGYFGNVDIGSGNVSSRNDVAGTVNITIPAHIYPSTANISPDARTNIPITIFSVKWEDSGVTPSVIQAHRWAVIERYKPGDNALGNVLATAGFTSLT